MIEFKILSKSNNLSGLICSINHDDLNSLNDLGKLFDLKNASTFNTECFSWPEPFLQPLFVVLIYKKSNFSMIFDAVEASLWHLLSIWNEWVKSQMLTAPEHGFEGNQQTNVLILLPLRTI